MATVDEILLTLTQLQLRNVFMGTLRFGKQLHMSSSTIKALIFSQLIFQSHVSLFWVWQSHWAVLKSTSSVHGFECIKWAGWEMICQTQTAKLLQGSPKRRKRALVNEVLVPSPHTAQGSSACNIFPGVPLQRQWWWWGLTWLSPALGCAKVATPDGKCSLFSEITQEDDFIFEMIFRASWLWFSIVLGAVK